MPLADDLAAFQRDGAAAFAGAADAAAVEAARIALLGRQGCIVALQEAFRAAPPEDKRTLGPLFNAAKQAAETAWKEAQARLADQGDGGPLDITQPATAHRPGSIHPLSRLGREVERVFTSMGFSVVDGPHAEHDDYNFTRLNIPKDHPARDAQDTFWLTDGRCLRTHTSSVQSRFYELAGQGRLALPLRSVVVGRVFRYEAVDATHDNTFTQVEGFVVDRGITVSHLVGTLTTLLKGLIGRDDVEVRLRPAYYPFVEPGFDVDIRSPSAPPEVRYHDWMELLGCGMIHPQVLRNGGIDPEQWNGFAFGLGLERLAMVRHGISDIRVFHGGDLRSLRQFAY
jgi:phenylalanyl-tRNA synthetase alpha chain